MDKFEKYFLQTSYVAWQYSGLSPKSPNGTFLQVQTGIQSIARYLNTHQFEKSALPRHFCLVNAEPPCEWGMLSLEKQVKYNFKPNQYILLWLYFIRRSLGRTCSMLLKFNFLGTLKVMLWQIFEERVKTKYKVFQDKRWELTSTD